MAETVLINGHVTGHRGRCPKHAYPRISPPCSSSAAAAASRAPVQSRCRTRNQPGIASGLAVVGNDPLNGTDPTGLCVKGFGFFCKAVHKAAHVADRVRHDTAAAAENPIVQTVATVVITAPLDATGAGEAIDATVISGESAAEGSAVIGESMARVQPVADELGAETFSPSAEKLSEDALMKENTDWINSCMDRGLVIYDCGTAPGRPNFPGISSPYYQMETDQIAARGYQNYVRLNMGGR